MIRGTTPTHTFTLPFDVSNISKLKIIYAQNDSQIFCKGIEDCKLNGNTVSVSLTQSETLKFDHKKMVQIQLRVLSGGGDSLVSNVFNTSVGECLDNEVLE